MLGLWLFASVFILAHPFIRALHGAILGALVVTVALAAIMTGVERLLRINAGVAAWLALSALGIRSGTGAPIANDLIVAALVFGFSIRPTSPLVRA